MVGLSQYTDFLVYCIICHITIVLQFENWYNICHNILHNQNMQRFTAKWSRNVGFCMQSEYKIQPSCSTLFHLRIHIMENSNKKPKTVPLEEKNACIYHLNTSWASFMFICPCCLIIKRDSSHNFNKLNENNILWYMYLISQYG